MKCLHTISVVDLGLPFLDTTSLSFSSDHLSIVSFFLSSSRWSA